MDGTLTIEQGSLYDFLDICVANVRHAGAHPLTRALIVLERLLRRVHQYNPMHRARTNVAHHYDLSDTLYGLFLDADRQYSCAYFTHTHDDLEQAQQGKKRHLAAKLLLEPGVRVLDIGSGWGGLGLYLAEAGDAQVVGITLSEEQLKVSRARADGRVLTIACASSCAITGRCAARSTGSSRSVCSSTSASAISASSLPPCGIC